MSDGADLARQLTRPALTVGRVLVLLRQVADGLDAMHGAGVLHLDVKPANVLVGRVHRQDSPRRTDTGASTRAYLTDLGLCRFLSDGPGSRPRAGLRRLAPLLLARAPARADGAAVADVYSLTCMLFACLAGQPAVRRRHPRRGHRPPVRPGAVAGGARPRCRAGLDRVVRRGMHPDPARASRSCPELITAARLAIVARPDRLSAACPVGTSAAAGSLHSPR